MSHRTDDPAGRNSPAPLIQRCTCANPGADLMTTVCDCGTPTTTRCDCHATEHDFYDPRLEGEPEEKECSINQNALMTTKAPTEN